jgi:hypothetical protein
LISRSPQEGASRAYRGLPASSTAGNSPSGNALATAEESRNRAVLTSSRRARSISAPPIAAWCRHLISAGGADRAPSPPHASPHPRRRSVGALRRPEPCEPRSAGSTCSVLAFPIARVLEIPPIASAAAAKAGAATRMDRRVAVVGCVEGSSVGTGGGNIGRSIVIVASGAPSPLKLRPPLSVGWLVTAVRQGRPGGRGVTTSPRDWSGRF